MVTATEVWSGLLSLAWLNSTSFSTNVAQRSYGNFIEAAIYIKLYFY